MVKSGFDLLALLFKWLNISATYRELKNNPEEAKKSTVMGKYGLINSIIGIIANPLLLLGFLKCIEGLSTMAFFLYFFLIILICVLMLYITVVGTINALVFTIYQLKLNKKAIGWASLAFLILLVLETVAVVAILCSL